MPVFVVGLSHRTSPVAIRERLAFAEGAIPSALAQLRARARVEEAVIVSTCNRVEIYAAGDADPARTVAALRDFLLNFHGFQEPLTTEIYGWPEPRSLEHLCRVAAGLDSMVLGETEVLGQVKRAYDLALRSRCTGRRLNKAFQRAFNVAKQLRSETNIQRGSISVASVAVDLAEKIFSSLSDRTVLVIGAGDTSEKTARALLSRGAAGVIVTNRSFDRAAALAQALGGQALPFEAWTSAFGRIDIAISSTAAPHHILDRARLEALMRPRRQRPLLLIDIAVPRDIAPEVNQMDGVFLYNIDDLQTIAEGALRQRQEDVAHCNAVIRERVKGLLSTASPEPDPSPRPSPQPETAAEVHRVGERVAEPGEGDRFMFTGQFKKEQVSSPEPADSEGPAPRGPVPGDVGGFSGLGPTALSRAQPPCMVSRAQAPFMAPPPATG